MAKKISHFQLGLFFLISLVIVVGGLIWAGTTHVFTSAKTYVTFFNESVQGLNPGARVTYLGVQVGTSPGHRYCAGRETHPGKDAVGIELQRR